MSLRARARRSVHTGGLLPAARLLWLALLVLTLPAVAAPASLDPALTRSSEWQRLVALWSTMLDHSSDVIYSPARFEQLAGEADAVDGLTGALAKRNLLPPPIASDLAKLFRDRYEYIGSRHYTTESEVSLTAPEAAAATAQWIVELQLAFVRGAPDTTKQQQTQIAHAEQSISYELSFLREYRDFEAEADDRRNRLIAQQSQGKEVDSQAFENDCQRRRKLLVDAYHRRRIRPSRPVRALLPYVVALTRAGRPVVPGEPSDLLPGL